MGLHVFLGEGILQRRDDLFMTKLLHRPFARRFWFCVIDGDGVVGSLC